MPLTHQCSTVQVLNCLTPHCLTAQLLLHCSPSVVAQYVSVWEGMREEFEIDDRFENLKCVGFVALFWLFLLHFSQHHPSTDCILRNFFGAPGCAHTAR